MPGSLLYPEKRVKKICRLAQRRPPAARSKIVLMAKRHPIRPHLRAWRNHYGRTLEWVAEQLGVGVSSVFRWENGENGVQEETFRAIAEAYGITPAELSAPVEDAVRARAMHRLLEAVRDIEDARLERLAQIAEDLKTPSKSPQG